jgi:hypothetical protein
VPQPGVAATPGPPGPVAPAGHVGEAGPARPVPTISTVAVVFVSTAAATAVWGIPAGFAWAAAAPRVLVEVVGHGIAQVVNAETSAFIVADVWFCLIGVIGGLLTGSLGYLIAVRRWGAASAAGLIAGALAAAAVALWVGALGGHAAFQHQLAVSAPGTRLNAPLALGAKSGLTFWPMLAALTIAVIEVVIRSRSAHRPVRQYAGKFPPGGRKTPPPAGARKDRPG